MQASSSALSSSDTSVNPQPQRRGLAGKFVIMLVLFLLFLAGVAGWKYHQIQGFIALGKTFAPPPASVSTVKAVAETWRPVLRAVGTTASVNGVVVTTDLSGIVTEIKFESGAKVRQGDLLVQLDIKAEEAARQSALARRELARINLNRSTELLKTSAIAKSEGDTSSAEFKQADAAVEEAAATVARKTIRAPFDGTLGIRQVQIGQYLKGGDPVVPLVSMNPIYVNFSLPQQELGNLAVGKEIQARADGVDGDFTGKITAINSTVDEATRNIQVQATVENPDEKLRAGMFVDVDVMLPATDGVIAVPSSAINYAPYGNTVFVLVEKTAEDGTKGLIAEQRVVKLGATRGDQVAIVSGLKEGDVVATSGIFKLRNQAPVQINNEILPGNEAAPKPADT